MNIIAEINSTEALALVFALLAVVGFGLWYFEKHKAALTAQVNAAVATAKADVAKDVAAVKADVTAVADKVQSTVGKV